MDDKGWAYGKQWKEEKDVWLLLGNLREETLGRPRQRRANVNCLHLSQNRKK
jgi:hypothetical protein